MKNKKIVIIGAGPIGCYLSRLLQQKGIFSLLIEEHQSLGRPLHCAGVVGKKVFSQAKITLSKESILNTLNGAYINLGKERMGIRREGVAYVIDREKFDEKMGQKLNIKFDTRFIGLEKKNGKYLIETDKGYFEADIVIGTDGARSLVRDLINKEKVDCLIGVQFRMKLDIKDKDMVEVFMKKPYFYWIIPEGNNIARVGTISPNAYQNLLEFIQEKKLEGKVLNKFAGAVPLGYVDTLEKNNVILLGDSASQIKPLTYGGVYMGMRAAEILANCLVEGKIKQYPAIWSRYYGRELKVAHKIRNALYRISDSDLREIFLFIKKNKKIIEKKGDFENHLKIIKELLVQPGLSKNLWGVFFRMAKNSFLGNH
ncbi:MAG: NAD(P)/FAD-dependent oxidoreductase [Candidatus Omnitrophota bacterium]